MMRVFFCALLMLIGCEACHPKMDPVQDTTTTTTTTTTTEETTTTTEAPPCPDGWTESERTNGLWCLKMEDLSDVTYAAAQTACTAVGGVVSSVESPDEWTLISSLRLDASAYIILGAQLTADCPCTALISCGAAGSCSLQTAFDWTDGFVNGRAVLDEASGSYGDTLYISAGDTFHSVQAAMMVGTPTNAICGKQGT